MRSASMGLTDGSAAGYMIIFLHPRRGSSGGGAIMKTLVPKYKAYRHRIPPSPDRRRRMILAVGPFRPKTPENHVERIRISRR